MIYGAQDLRAFFRTGPRVSFTGKSTYPDGQPIQGLFDRPMQNKLADQGGGGIDIGLPEIRLPFNAFNPMPRSKETITVDGKSYTIADVGAEDEGAIVVYGLKLA